MKLVAMGDSTTVGVTSGSNKSPYTDFLKQQFPLIKAINRGREGEKTKQMLMRFQADVLDERPAWLVLWGGQNDVFIHYSKSEVIRNLMAMVDLAKHKGIRVLVVGLPLYPHMWREKQFTWEYIFKTTSINLDLLIRSFLTGFQFIPFYFTKSDDGIHPNAWEYERLAVKIGKIVS